MTEAQRKEVEEAFRRLFDDMQMPHEELMRAFIENLYTVCDQWVNPQDVIKALDAIIYG